MVWARIGLARSPATPLNGLSFSSMQLDQASSLIRSHLNRMTVTYGEVVFDEWVLIGLTAAGGRILAYEGPRAEDYKRTFVRDLAPLRAVIAGGDQDVGGFEFVNDAAGHRYDAVMRVGPGAYLLANHTTSSLADIRANAGWIKAQTAWFGLGEKFRADPLEV